MAESRNGNREIREALAESRRLFLSCGLFSVFVNLLMLTGPLFMLQVYDRVLTSRSEATLVTLIAIVAFLFLMMGVLDHARGRVLARAGARLQARLDSRVLRAILSRSTSPAERSRPATGLRDLEAIQRFASSSGPFAFFDAPWTPVFLFALFMFHWMLGLLAVGSGCLLLLIALLNQRGTARPQEEVREASARSWYFIEQMRAGGETVQGLGMHDAVVARSGALRDTVLDKTLSSSDRGGFYNVLSKTLRLFLQSLMLGLGAWLAILGEITPGVMIAASILLGRALAPIDQAVGQWPLLQRTLAGYRSLAALLTETPPERARTALPAPRAILEAQGLMVAAPGARVAAVRGASLRLEPGQAAGIAGPSASGKSTFARALAGVWRPMGGSVRLDGAELDQYGADLGAPHRVSAAGSGPVRWERGGEHRPALARRRRQGDRRGGETHRRARDDSRPAGRLRLSGLGGRRGPVGGTTPAHRARARVLRLSGGGGDGRAGLQPGCGRNDGAVPCSGAPQEARRRGRDRGASAWSVRAVRHGLSDGGRSSRIGHVRPRRGAGAIASIRGRHEGRGRSARGPAHLRRRRQVEDPAAVGGTGGARPPVGARDAGRDTAEPGGNRPEARPVVTIVRGGQKGAAGAPATSSRAPAGRTDGTPAHGAPAAKASATDSAATRRQRRIAGAVARVRGVRAPAGEGQGRPGRHQSRAERLGSGAADGPGRRFMTDRGADRRFTARRLWPWGWAAWWCWSGGLAGWGVFASISGAVHRHRPGGGGIPETRWSSTSTAAR